MQELHQSQIVQQKASLKSNRPVNLPAKTQNAVASQSSKVIGRKRSVNNMEPTIEELRANVERLHKEGKKPVLPGESKDDYMRRLEYAQSALEKRIQKDNPMEEKSATGREKRRDSEKMKKNSVSGNGSTLEK
jgi:hypothetical protein